MRKFFYVAIAAIVLMVVSCSQKTPAEEALANYKAAIEKISNFDGNEEEFFTLMQECQEVEQEFLKYDSEYSQETIDEVKELAMEAFGSALEKIADLKGGFGEEMEEFTDNAEVEITEIAEQITEE